MTTTDVHGHYVPQLLLERIAAGDARAVRTVETPDGVAVQIEGEQPTRPLKGKLRDLEQRGEWLVAEGIDRQVIGSWADLFGYGLGRDDAEQWSRLIDTTMREATAGDERWITLSTPPIQHPDLAAERLRAAAEEGHGGAMIGTDADGMELDDARLDVFWQAAVDTGLPILIHPGYCADPRLNDMGLINAVGRGVDTTIASARLLHGGVLERFPDLTLVLSHGGAGLPGLLGRLARNHAVTPGLGDPVAGFARLYFDSVVHDARTLRFLLSLASPGHVLLGSDYPFPIGDLSPVRTVDAAELSADERAAVLTRGAALFGAR